jgi:hypothetical protein
MGERQGGKEKCIGSSVNICGATLHLAEINHVLTLANLGQGRWQLVYGRTQSKPSPLVTVLPSTVRSSALIMQHQLIQLEILLLAQYLVCELAVVLEGLTDPARRHLWLFHLPLGLLCGMCMAVHTTHSSASGHPSYRSFLHTVHFIYSEGNDDDAEQAQPIPHLPSLKSTAASPSASSALCPTQEPGSSPGTTCALALCSSPFRFYWTGVTVSDAPCGSWYWCIRRCGDADNLISVRGRALVHANWWADAARALACNLSLDLYLGAVFSSARSDKG